jgi:hypothetical protein
MSQSQNVRNISCLSNEELEFGALSGTKTTAFSTPTIFEEYVEYEYIKQMMEDVKKNKEKYEQNRRELRVPWDKTDVEFTEDFKNQEGFLRYVEKEYTYFRNIVQHYSNLEKK